VGFRATVSASRDGVAVIAVGGDIPPEIESRALGRVSATLVCRGSSDDWYTLGKFSEDIGGCRPVESTSARSSLNAVTSGRPP
jgi:hypothetical protein